MPRLSLIASMLIALAAPNAQADELLFSHEGDVLPSDPASGFEVFNPCEPPCYESIHDGVLVFQWIGAGDFVIYARRVADAPSEPETFWAEWRYRSDLPEPAGFTGCDGNLVIQFRSIVSNFDLHGDGAEEWTAGQLFGLPLNEFRTLRFESTDGLNFMVFTDGRFFGSSLDPPGGPGSTHLRFGGIAGCPPIGGSIRNEWDFVRCGTMTGGESISSTEPPAGILSVTDHPNFDRFVVNFNRPAFVSTTDMSVEVTGGVEPIVSWVRRPDGSGPETAQIVLDRPLPLGETTRIILDTGGEPQVIEYTYLQFGACCLPAGSCFETHEGDCSDQSGSFVPDAVCEPATSCCRGPICEQVASVCCAAPVSSCEGDGDGDGTDASCGDQCPMDAQKIHPGQCGCGQPDLDTDLDTIADALTNAPARTIASTTTTMATPTAPSFSPSPPPQRGASASSPCSS